MKTPEQVLTEWTNDTIVFNPGGSNYPWLTTDEFHQLGQSASISKEELLKKPGRLFFTRKEFEVLASAIAIGYESDIGLTDQRALSVWSMIQAGIPDSVLDWNLLNVFKSFRKDGLTLSAQRILPFESLLELVESSARFGWLKRPIPRNLILNPPEEPLLVPYQT